MAEGAEILQRRYHCHSSIYQWFAVVTLLVNPLFGSISLFFWIKSRHSLVKGKARESSRRLHLSLVFGICGLLCTSLVLIHVVLGLSGVLTPSPLNLKSSQRLTTLKPQIQSYQNFRERFFNKPLPEESKNDTGLWGLFESAFL